MFIDLCYRDLLYIPRLGKTLLRQIPRLSSSDLENSTDSAQYEVFYENYDTYSTDSEKYTNRSFRLPSSALE